MYSSYHSIFYSLKIYLFLDLLYEKYDIKEVLAVACLYSLLIVEQSYITALTSSGIFIIILFISIFKKKAY